MTRRHEIENTLQANIVFDPHEFSTKSTVHPQVLPNHGWMTFPYSYYQVLDTIIQTSSLLVLLTERCWAQWLVNEALLPIELSHFTQLLREQRNMSMKEKNITMVISNIHISQF